MKSFSRSRLRLLLLTAFFLALDIVLVRLLSLNLWNLKLNLGFLAVAGAAYFCGTLPAVFVAAAGDFLGAILFPVGVYFPGFTITAALSGLVFGLLIHEKTNIWGIGVLVLVDQFFLSLIINTALISQLYSVPFLSLLPLRLLQAFLMGMLESCLFVPLLTIFDRIKPSSRR